MLSYTLGAWVCRLHICVWLSKSFLILGCQILLFRQSSYCLTDTQQTPLAFCASLRLTVRERSLPDGHLFSAPWCHWVPLSFMLSLGVVIFKPKPNQEFLMPKFDLDVSESKKQVTKNQKKKRVRRVKVLTSKDTIHIYMWRQQHLKKSAQFDALGWESAVFSYRECYCLQR